MRKQLLIACLFCFALQMTKAQTPVSDSIISELNEWIAKQDHLLPNKADKIQKIAIGKNTATITLTLSEASIKKLDESEVDEITEHLLPILPDFKVETYYIGVEERGKFKPLEDFLTAFEPIVVPMEYDNNTDKQSLVSEKNAFMEEIPELNTVIPALPRKNGMLRDKTVWVSAGHGWLYGNGRWKTQRINNFGVVEDFGSIEAVNYYLLKYLENAGANVWTVRERDMNVNEVIVDDEDSGFSTKGYWAKSTSQGYGKNYKYIYSQSKATAAAIYTPDIPESGWYWVSVNYRSGANRTKEARYLVKHAGGETVVPVNQETHGMTWVYLGQFYFEKGRQGSVTLTNQSSDLNQAIIADAVRFGGGKSSVPDRVGGLSKEPRFEEAALYYSKFQGYNYGTSDVTVRPRYAEWELAKGTWAERANACYVSWHTNAGGGRGTGTETFMYNGKATKGSQQLRDFIHQEVVKDIKTEWDAKWYDRGKKSANFGELRDLTTMPGALIEIAFHDNEQDAEALKTPKFRQLAARAVYKGIVRYFAAQQGKDPVFLPEPPTHLFAQSNKNDIVVGWKAPASGDAKGDAATGYKVYVSAHGKAFAEPIEVNGTSFTLKNAKAGLTYYFKVTATNAGGESFETPIVAVRPPSKSGQKTEFLIVDGFDRLDKFGAVSQYDGDYLGTTKRLFLERMNNYDYAVYHAQGLEKAGFSFDGATNEAIYDNLLNLTNYPAVDWFLGEESSEDNSLNKAERDLVQAYLTKGGALMISGAEHAYELSRMPNGADPVFFRNYLKSAFYADNAKTYKFVGDKGGIMDNLIGSFSDDSGLYNVDYPDVLVPYGGGQTVLTYDGGLGRAAAVAYSGNDFKVINFGFPIESVPDNLLRNEIIFRAARFLVKPANANSSDVVVSYEDKPLEDIDFSKLPNPANISPNPFMDNIIIDISGEATGKASFVLMNSRGQKICKLSWTHVKGRKKSTLINKKFPKGFYDYELIINKKVLKGKLYKQ